MSRNRPTPDNTSAKQKEVKVESALIKKPQHEDVIEALLGGTDFTNVTLLYESRSGFMRLFRAKRHGKWFALKCLKEEYRENPELMAKLRKEFEIGFKISHNSVTSTYALEFDERFGLVIVLEWIDGVTLEDFIADGAINSENILPIAKSIADAIDYLHSRQIIHCDIKLENIMMTRVNAEPKLIDFGFSDTPDFAIAKHRGSTVDFVAPEMYDDCSDINERVDIYAYGAVLKYMNDSLRHPKRRLARFAELCMAKNPDDRPARLSDFRFERRNRFWSILAAFSAIAVVSIVAVLAGKGHTSNNAEASARTHVVHDTIVVEVPAAPDPQKMEFLNGIEENVKNLFAGIWDRFIEDVKTGKAGVSQSFQRYNDDLEMLSDKAYRMAEKYISDNIPADDPDYHQSLSIAKSVVDREIQRIVMSSDAGMQVYESVEYYNRTNKNRK